MRELFDHKKDNDHSKAVQVVAIDGPGPGGASHFYRINLLGATDENGVACDMHVHELHFQNGAVQEVGINGISNEALITVCIDRLRGFQSGLFANRDNAIALTKLEEALLWLGKRTDDRLRRGVEGQLVE